MIPEFPHPEEVELLHSKPIFDDSTRRNLLPPLLQSTNRLCFSAENLLGLHLHEQTADDSEKELKSHTTWPSTLSLSSSSSSPSLHKAVSQNIKQFSEKLRETIVHRLLTPVINIQSC
ncbi:unnamed protein product, partial [Mesorhabditis belari]|uniref:Uncharacterized protein n=1 Tax=Mesorhabditis belari TaxID=2138241 RepID=A0AAF3FR11_9BILA